MFYKNVNKKLFLIFLSVVGGVFFLQRSQCYAKSLKFDLYGPEYEITEVFESGESSCYCGGRQFFTQEEINVLKTCKNKIAKLSIKECSQLKLICSKANKLASLLEDELEYGVLIPNKYDFNIAMTQSQRILFEAIVKIFGKQM